MIENTRNESRSESTGVTDVNHSIKGVTLSWRDLSVYAMDRGSSICKQLINNGEVF